jgi:formylglycine-generating enzyme required for sulfatase activity
LAKYAWFRDNSDNRAWPVGMKKPNDYGLFDMNGNAWQWCDMCCKGYAVANGASVSDDSGKVTKVRDKVLRVYRGGSFNPNASLVRSSSRVFGGPSLHNYHLGFRPARTLL